MRKAAAVTLDRIVNASVLPKESCRTSHNPGVVNQPTVQKLMSDCILAFKPVGIPRFMRAGTSRVSAEEAAATRTNRNAIR